MTPTPRPPYVHVNVFASGPMSGNGLIVFPEATSWSTAAMQALAREMRQFESIFLSTDGAGMVTARVFTVEEELPFAGHPVLGAAAVLHQRQADPRQPCEWTLHLPVGAVQVHTQGGEDGRAVLATLRLGRTPEPTRLSEQQAQPFLAALGLSPREMPPDWPLAVASNGLPYLVVPVTVAGLARARIQVADLSQRLAEVGAKFALVLDVQARELRTWDNLGAVEDVATGSAAGPVYAYLCAQGAVTPGETLQLQQGRFAGRPSVLGVGCDEQQRVWVRGEVHPVAHGHLDFVPECQA